MTVADMETAISNTLSDGQTVYIAGFTHAIPFAAGHEIIRQGFSDLTLVRMTPDLIYDQMVASGCASKVVFSFAFRGLRRDIKEGDVEFEEYSHFGLMGRLTAGAYNLPFMPLRTFTGSDIPNYTDAIRTVESPYEEEEIHVVPPLNPDVTILHAHRADENGTAQMWGILGDIVDAAHAADTVIVTTEEIVSEEVVRSDPNRTVIPGSEVEYVVEEPFGAQPSYVQGLYDRDRTLYRSWDEIASTREGVMDWLDEWVYGVDNRREYLEKLDTGRFMDLHPETNYATPVDMGEYR